jgi:hypothetical protein
MTYMKAAVVSAVSAIVLCTGAVALAPAPGQVSIGVNLGGGPPVCPYGYFDYAPYDCAPYGYYGPDWFNGGVFLGAGPWFHGHRGWYGHVDNRYDPRNGYHGPLPERGARPFQHFQGNEARDGQGHMGDAGHDAHAEHSGGFAGGGRPGGGGGGHHR